MLPERPPLPDVHPGRRRVEARHGRHRLELQGTGERAAHAGRAAAAERQRSHPVVQPEAQPHLQRPAGRLGRRAEREDGRSGLDDLRDRGRHLRRRDRCGVGAVHPVLRRAGHERRAPLGAERRREPLPRTPGRVRREDGQAALADVEPAGPDAGPVHPLLGQPGRGRDRRRRRLVDPGRRSPARVRVLRHREPVPGDGPLARVEPVDGIRHGRRLEDRRAEVVLPGHPPRLARLRHPAPADGAPGPDRRQGDAGRRRGQQGRLLLRAERTERRSGEALQDHRDADVRSVG